MGLFEACDATAIAVEMYERTRTEAVTAREQADYRKIAVPPKLLCQVLEHHVRTEFDPTRDQSSQTCNPTSNTNV